MKKEDLVTELRAWGTNGYMMQAANEIERLRQERDEARREVCNATAHPNMEAHERGWDCFKEDTDG